MVKYLAAKELDISLRSWWRPKQSLKERLLDFVRCSETRLQMNANVSLKVHMSYELCLPLVPLPKSGQKNSMNAALSESSNTTD